MRNKKYSFLNTCTCIIKILMCIKVNTLFPDRGEDVRRPLPEGLDER